MEEQIVNDLFKMSKKGFWVGMGVGLFSLLAGLTFGISLVIEKEYRKEGLLVIIFSLLCFFIKIFIFIPWMMSLGILPQAGLVRLR